MQLQHVHVCLNVNGVFFMFETILKEGKKKKEEKI